MVIFVSEDFGGDSLDLEKIEKYFAEEAGNGILMKKAKD